MTLSSLIFPPGTGLAWHDALAGSSPSLSLIVTAYWALVLGRYVGADRIRVATMSLLRVADAGFGWGRTTHGVDAYLIGDALHEFLRLPHVQSLAEPQSKALAVAGDRWIGATAFDFDSTISGLLARPGRRTLRPYQTGPTQQPATATGPHTWAGFSGLRIRVLDWIAHNSRRPRRRY